MILRRLLHASMLLLLVALVVAALPACRVRATVRRCQACIEKEGAMYCGFSYTNLKKHADIDVDRSKLTAGRAACTEFGARKGGGYAGPPFEEARKTCADAVKASDLRRALCDEIVVDGTWKPRDGIDAL